MARKECKLFLGLSDINQYQQIFEKQVETLRAILLNSVPKEEGILMSILDELSKEERTAPQQQSGGKRTWRFLAMGAVCAKGWAPERRNCWVRAENWRFSAEANKSLLQQAHALPPWQVQRSLRTLFPREQAGLTVSIWTNNSNTTS